MSNKVHFNLKNCHYAPITAVSAAGVPTYGTPVAMAGAVSLSLDQQGDVTKFYADGIVYYQSASNNGYDGDLEVALIPDDFRVACLGETLDTTAKVYIENSNDEQTAFALLFEFDGDSKNIRHVLYNCSATRPKLEGKTVEDKKEIDTETISISAVSLSDGKVKARTGPETTETVYDAWYTAVWLPTV